MALSIQILNSSSSAVTKFANTGGQYTITITNSNALASWVNVNPEETDWCKVDSSSATSMSVWTITVTVYPENTGSARAFGIYAESEDTSHRFAIEQTAGTAVQPLSGEIKAVTPTSDISVNGEALTVDVKTVNGTDSLASASVVSGSFCTLTSTTHGVTSGADTVTRFVFTFAANTNFSTRSAVMNFTVSNGVDSYSLSLTKTQAAKTQEGGGTAVWSLYVPDMYAAAADTSKSVQIQDIGIYSSTYSVTSKPSWVSSCSFNTVNGVTTLTANFSANSGELGRPGNITVSATNVLDATVTCTFQITQAGSVYKRGNITILNKAVGSEDTSVSIEAHLDDMDFSTVTATSSDTWITSAEVTQDGTSYSLDLVFEENASHEERKGTITVTGTDIYNYRITTVVTLIQAAAKIVCDKIYRIDYTPGGTPEFVSNLLYEGNLGFSLDHPIESVVHFETDDIQKIYWVDGEHVLRFMNFAPGVDTSSWDDTTFDSNRIAGFGVDVLIEKDNTGETRANGVTQYILTYFNKHGQETGYVWMSDLVYLSPMDHGGSADGKNNNRVTMTLSNLDTSFTNFRIYSIFRSSLDGQVVAYLVDERKTSDDDVVVVDDGAHLEVQDTQRLLYLGSQSVKPGTIEHKDNTLFLGDLQSVGKADYDDLEELLRSEMFILDDPSKGFQDGIDYESNCIEFVYSGVSQRSGSDALSIPNVENSGNYPYINQLQFTSSQILSFKGGEKYRFALKFQMRDGTETDAFWIGDKVNLLYPYMDDVHNELVRVVAKCELPEAVLDYIRSNGKYMTARLCIAEAAYADRSIKAQGIVNPTMFNTWERYRNRVYSYPSWITRVRGAEFANSHFDVVECADKTNGEIQCNYWKDGQDCDAYFQYKDYDVAPTYFKELCGNSEFDKLLIAYRFRYKVDNAKFGAYLYKFTVGLFTGEAIQLTAGTILSVLAKAKAEFEVTAYIIKVKMLDSSDAASASINQKCFEIYDKDVGSHPQHNNKKDFERFWTPYGNDSVDSSKKNWRYHLEPNTNSPGHYYWRAELSMVKVSGKTYFNKGRARSKVEERMKAEFLSLGLGRYFPHSDLFHQWCLGAINASNHTYYMNQRTYKDSHFTNPANSFHEPYDAINPFETGASYPSDIRWINEDDYSVSGVEGDISPAYYKKHLMFVDENVLTLDSPELDQNAVQMDGADYKFRIVGVAKMTSVMSDYTVEASKSTVPGEDLDREIFSGNVRGHNRIDGLVTWPLWKEYGLALKDKKKDDDVSDEDRTFSDYQLTMQIVRYWLYMWQHSGCITGFTQTINEEITDEEAENGEDAEDLLVPDGKYSELKHKTWANLRYSYETMYLNTAQNLGVESIRTPLEYNTNTLRLTIGDDLKDYASNVQLNLLTPGDMKYPICYSGQRPDDINKLVTSDDAWIYSSAPVLLEYSTKTHAVISLMTNSKYPVTKDGVTNYFYRQNILPRFFESEKIDFDIRGQETVHDDITNTDSTVNVTGALIPWANYKNGEHFIKIHRNGNDIANPSYQAIAIQDGDYQYEFKTSGSGEQFRRYVEIIERAGEAFGDGAIFIAIDCGTSNLSGALTSGSRFVVNVEDAAVSYNESTGEYKVSFKDPRTIAYADVDNGYDDELPVDYSLAMYDNGDIIYKYIGAGDYYVASGVIEDQPYPYRDYIVNQPTLNSKAFVGGKKLNEGDPYVFIGEIYIDYTDPNVKDTRYGGISLSDVSGNRFVNAGPAYVVNKDGNAMDLYANEGDTYFQRFDSLRVKPYSKDAVNQIIDIASVMLETHINLDGRTDLMRGINELASIDVAQFGTINRVYSQKDNYIIRRDLDEDFNTDSFRSSVTWTLPKTDMASVDEWTHITLASTLKLDGDKGICNALKRFSNRLLAFQDKGISEIYFNAMTQLGTQEGVPIEIANSGKVTGKGYFTNNFGCTNKWSIAEGKTGLYFVDNINKAFCAVTVGTRGQLGASDVSTGKGFKIWFKNRNDVNAWRPSDFRNIISFFDQTNSDVYLVRKAADTESPCLVYNELLGEFTSFFDYSAVPMITNICDRLVSFKNHRLWLQNEGRYCNFFGEQKDFWMIYRVTPDPYGDKIWTNLEYRADFYRILNGDTVLDNTPEYEFGDGKEAFYQPAETFDYARFWTEYQTTNTSESTVFNPDKKFRIWRYQIPRAIPNGQNNTFGLDRIRNPWMNILLKKKYTSAADASNQDLMQMHDMTVIYFE